MLPQPGPSSVPHLPFFTGAASQGIPSAQNQPPITTSHSPSVTVTAQSSYIPNPGGYSVVIDAQPKPDQRPLASPQANMDSAMAKRDAIAKRLSMMGPGGPAASSLLPVLYNHNPTQLNQYSAPSDTQMQGPSNQRSLNGVMSQHAQGGYPQAENTLGYHNVQMGFPAAESSRNVTPQGANGNRLGQSHNGTGATNGDLTRKSSTGNADGDISVRSKSPLALQPSRHGSFQTDRAALAGEAGRNEFGRDRVNRRSASPRRNGGDGRDSKRPRTGEADFRQIYSQTEVSLKCLFGRIFEAVR